MVNLASFKAQQDSE